MKKLVLLLAMVLGVVSTSLADISVQTRIFDANSQPMLVGGFIENYLKQNVSKKGVIVSKSADDMIITDNTEFDNATIFLQGKATGRINNPCDIRFIDCSDTNEEQFACALQFLVGNTDYYVKAFAIDNDNNISYGSTEKVHTQDYNRYNGWADYANVWYAFDHTLFDVVTDELIDPNNGFYYTTNENPERVEYQTGTSYNTCYKLATEWNYKLWYCQWYYGTLEYNSSKVVHLPVMSYSNGMLTIEKSELDADKDITIYYSINGNYFRPETYTEVYSQPLNISEPCIVYCYAISSEGYISYTNLYAIGNYTTSHYKSLDDYIAISNTTIKDNVMIYPIIHNVKKIYIDLTKGTTNGMDCYSALYSYNSLRSITYSSKYLQSTTSDNIILTENKKDTRLNIKNLADNKTYSWLYYNPQNPNEVIIDAEEYMGCLGYIADWQVNFGTSCVVNIVTDNSIDQLEKVADVVDLGLSVKWASWNIGASMIADYGGLYGAGDPTGLLTSTSYDDYHWVEGENISGTEYDLAHVKWGGKWQLPTSAQLLELKEKCTWEHNVIINNVIGSVATGPNGNTLFFPYAGSRDGSSNPYFGEHTSLWASEAFFNDVRNYKDMDINLPSGSFQFDGCKSYCGQSIRPIYVEEKLHLTDGYTEVEYIQAPKEIYTSSQAWTVPNDLQENYNYIIEFTPLDWEDSYYGNIIGGHDGDSVFPNLGMHKLDNGWGGMEKRFITAFWNYNLETRYQSPGGNYRVYSGVRSRFQLHCKNYDSSQGAEIIVDNEGFDTYSYTSTSIYRSGYSVETGVYDIPLFTQTGNTRDVAAFMKLHSFKVEDKNGKAIYDYVPCVRNSDSKVGLYDRVNDAFYYPSAFDLIAGAEVQNVPNSQYKSLDDYIKESSLDTISNEKRIHISPKITNVKKVYVDLKKGSDNSSWCYLWIDNSNMSSKFIEISSKYLQSTSTDNFVLWENDNGNRLSIKELADDKTFSWLYYNPDNSNEVIIDIEQYLGGLGIIENWQQNFETSCIVNIVTDNSINQFEKVGDVVDLGLSVKWASWNIGASKIGDYGGLYGAGDPTGQKTSTNSEDYYFKDGESICGTEYDLAHVKWGGYWRMPNWKEMEELINNCTWTTGEVDGVKGSWVTGPNGNSIFLPWAGNRYGASTFSGEGIEGHYYSGDMGVSLHSSGYKDFDIGDSGVFQTDGAENYWGQSIRPVYNDSGSTTPDVSTKRTIHVETAGTLPDLISESEKYYIEELTLTGELNGTDFRLLRDMAGCNYLGEETVGKLKVLDLSDAKIVKGGERYVDANQIPGFGWSTDGYRTNVEQDNVFPKYVFSGCIFTSVIIPNSVSSIESGAFSYCSSLPSIIIPNSVTSIGTAAFSKCSGLSYISIPTSVTRIEYYAFSGCTGLTSIKIPYTVTYISNYAFEGCTGLTSITVESENTKYDSRDDCNAIIETKTNTMVLGCSTTSIPTSVIRIGDGAFAGSSITSITIPSTVTSIGNWAFNGCSSLAFATIPNTVTSIDTGVFLNCISLSSITIPNSVTNIGGTAFSGCSSLTSVVSEIVKPFEISENVFSDYSKPTLTVPNGTKSAYQSTAGWNKFMNIVEATVNNDGFGKVADMVDLGLSVRWASWNVGANKPEGLGELYAWGELEPKNNYTSSTYKFYNGGYTKYGSVDNKYRLDSEDDVARQKWGDKWRIPTFEELKELKEKCTFTETELNGVPVTKVTGPNGNFIYFPYPGNYTGITLYFENSVGSYWSSDLETNSYAKDIDFQNGTCALNGDTRYHGQAIRPVSDDTIDVPNPNDKVKVPGVVDLGLTSGLLWAACNIGASTPEEYGLYFAWGETAPKENYYWDTYKFGVESNFTKYNYNDGLTELELEDDAAYVILGKDWRMPTHAEELELVNECTWESVTVNGISGYKITGPNGNSIFMPRGGLYDGTDYDRDGTKLSSVNTGGWYWSSTLNSAGSSYAQGLCFFPSLLSNVTDHERCDGHNIRPVFIGDPNNYGSGISTIVVDRIKDDVYYNLQGQRVVNPRNGIYILNGKKVLIK